MDCTLHLRQAGHLRCTTSSAVSSSKTGSGLFSAFYGSAFVSTIRIERVYFFVVRLVGTFHVCEFLMCQLWRTRIFSSFLHVKFRFTRHSLFSVGSSVEKIKDKRVTPTCRPSYQGNPSLVNFRHGTKSSADNITTHVKWMFSLRIEMRICYITGFAISMSPWDLHDWEWFKNNLGRITLLRPIWSYAGN